MWVLPYLWPCLCRARQDALLELKMVDAWHDVLTIQAVVRFPVLEWNVARVLEAVGLLADLPPKRSSRKDRHFVPFVLRLLFRVVLLRLILQSFPLFFTILFLSVASLSHVFLTVLTSPSQTSLVQTLTCSSILSLSMLLAEFLVLVLLHLPQMSQMVGGMAQVCSKLPKARRSTAGAASCREGSLRLAFFVVAFVEYWSLARQACDGGRLLCLVHCRCFEVEWSV